MKRSLFLLVCMVLLFLVVACGNTETPPATTTLPSQDTICTITLISDIGTLDTDTLFAVSGSTLVLPTPENVGAAWSFLGWSVSETEVPMTTLTVTETCTLRAVWSARDGGDFTFTAANGAVTLRTYDGTADTLSVPAELAGLPVRTLGERLFANNQTLREVTLPDSITKLEREVFAGCTALTSVSLPANLRDLPDRAFFGCTKLQTIVLPDTLQTMGEGCFADCTALTALSLPADVRLSSYTFSGCTNLSDLTLPERITDIPVGMANGCAALAELALPQSLCTIGDYAFADTALIRVTLPAATETIGAWAFSRTPLVTISLSASLEYVGAGAFAGCTSLSAFDAGNTALQILGARAFRGCETLTRVTLPQTLRQMGASAFAACASLAELTVPFLGETPLTPAPLVYLFDAQSFPNAYAVGDTYLPRTLQTVTVTGEMLAPAAFADCVLLKTVHLTGRLYVLPERAFAGAYNLTKVTLPEALTAISAEAFSGCRALTSLTLPAQLSTLHASVFTGCSVLSTLYVDCYMMAANIHTHPVGTQISILYLAESVVNVLETGLPVGYQSATEQDTLLYVKYVRA